MYPYISMESTIENIFGNGTIVEMNFPTIFAITIWPITILILCAPLLFICLILRLELGRCTVTRILFDYFSSIGMSIIIEWYIYYELNHISSNIINRIVGSSFKNAIVMPAMISLILATILIHEILEKLKSLSQIIDRCDSLQTQNVLITWTVIGSIIISLMISTFCYFILTDLSTNVGIAHLFLVFNLLNMLISIIQLGQFLIILYCLPEYLIIIYEGPRPHVVVQHVVPLCPPAG